MAEFAAAQTAFAKVSMSSDEAPPNGLHHSQPPALAAFTPLTAPAAVTRLQSAGGGMARHEIGRTVIWCCRKLYEQRTAFCRHPYVMQLRGQMRTE